MVEFKTSRVMPQPRQASPISTATGDALTQLGGVVQGVANKFTEFYEKEARIQNELLLAKTEAEWSRRFKEAERTAGRGFSGRIVQEFDAYRTKMMQTAPKRGRDEVNLALDKYRIGLEERAVNAELAAAARAAKAAAAEAANLRLNNLISNPDPELLSQYMTAHPKQANDYVRAYNSARMMDDPAAVLEEMRAGTWDAFITPSQKLSFIEGGVAAVARQDRERQAELAVQQDNLAAALDEEIAYAQMNGAPPVDGIGNSIEDVAAALFSPEKATEFVADYRDQMAVAQMVYNVGSASPDELDAQLTVLKANIAQPGRTPEDVDNMRRWSEAYAARQQAISSDAAGHALRINDEVAANYAETANDDPEVRQIAASNYVAASEAEYDRLGVNPINRKLLPAARAKALVNELQTVGIDVAAQTLAGIRADWNNDPRLVRELQAAGLAPEYASALRNADNPGLASAILGTATIPLADLKAGMLPTAIKDIDEGMTEGLEDFAAAFTAGDVTGDASKTFAAEFAITQKLVLQAVKAGQDPGEASERIIGQMFPGEVINTSEVKLIIPEGVGVVTTERALADFMMPDRIRAFDPAPLDDPSLPEFADAEIVIESAANGVWLMNDRSDGAVLHLNVGGYYLPLTNRKGDYYDVSFRDIAGYDYMGNR